MEPVSASLAMNGLEEPTRHPISLTCASPAEESPFRPGPDHCRLLAFIGVLDVDCRVQGSADTPTGLTRQTL